MKTTIIIINFDQYEQLKKAAKAMHCSVGIHRSIDLNQWEIKVFHHYDATLFHLGYWLALEELKSKSPMPFPLPSLD